MTNQVETHIDVQLTNRNRTTVFWRGVLVVPFLVFISSFESGWFHAGWSSAAVVAPAFLTLIFREVYPSFSRSIRIFSRIDCSCSLKGFA